METELLSQLGVVVAVWRVVEDKTFRRMVKALAPLAWVGGHVFGSLLFLIWVLNR
jgi:hypothetical protein